MRKFISIALIIALTGCSLNEKAPATIKQSYFATKQLYQTTLVAAVSYKKWCLAKKNPADHCNEVVEKIQDADKQIYLSMKNADMYLEQDDLTKLDIVTASLKLSLDQLAKYTEDK